MTSIATSIATHRTPKNAREAVDGLVEAVAVRAAELVLERLGNALETAPEPVSPWLTVPEAADMLRCKRQRIDDLLSAGRLSRFKEGGRTLVSRPEVEALVQVDRVAQALPIASADCMVTRRAA